MKRNRFRFVSLLIALTLLPVIVSGRVQPATQAVAAAPGWATDDIWNVEFMGHIGGVTQAVAVQGIYAYIGEGPRLTILNISNPALPSVVGKTRPLPGIVEDVAVAGSYAYVTDGGSGLRIINVANPAAPIETGFYDTPVYAQGVAVAGSYAYVADGGSGLRIINVANPAAPTEISFYDTPGVACDVALAGSYAYVADGYDGGLRIINVANPAAPTETGFYVTSGGTGSVAVAGSYAYVADGSSGLRIINIFNPAAPTETGFYDTPGSARDVAVAGSYAYIADGGSGLRIINVTNPAAPIETGFYNTPDDAYCVAVAGSDAYVADGEDGLRIISVANPAAPTEISFYSIPGYAHDVAVVGDHAYVADSYSGLHIIDVASTAALTEIGFYNTPGDAHDVAVAGSYAYIADGSSGLRIINVANPAAPIEIGFYDTPDYAWDVAVAGSYAYVADGSSGLRIINVANPAAPTETGFYDTPVYAQGVAVAGSYAYLTDDSSLRIINVTNPAAPTETGFYDMPESARRVAVARSYAYVADGGSGLRIISVANPAAPTGTGFYDTPGWAYGVAVAGSYAYVADINGGLRIINVTNPTAPTETGFYDTPGYAEGVALAGSDAYVADQGGGLFILCALDCDDHHDADNDGLPNGWELCGHNGVDLPAMGADPLHKDVFVEIDYMGAAYAGCFLGHCWGYHSHQPQADAIARVVDAFANSPVDNPDGTQGIHLHVDFGPDAPLTWGAASVWGDLSQAEELEHQETVENDAQQPWDDWRDWPGFDRIRDEQGHFRPDRSPIFHYAVFAHYLGGTVGGYEARENKGGISRNDLSDWGPFRHGGASDLVVSLGGYTNHEGTVLEQASIFMHELGHNLGLHHGGGDEVVYDPLNFKPNYLSAMNSLFHGDHGLIIDDTDGHLDYSRFDSVPPLNEQHLNETIGLNDVALDDYGTRWRCFGGAITKTTLDANAPIDWDCLWGAGGTDVQADITGQDGLDVLESYNDWSNLAFDMGYIGTGTTGRAAATRLPGSTNIIVLDEEKFELDVPYRLALGPNRSLVTTANFSTTISITLTNVGTSTVTAFFDYLSNSSWYDLSQVPISTTLFTSASLSIPIGVLVPETAQSGDSQQLVLRATAVESPLMGDNVRLEILVGPRARYEAEPVSGAVPHTVAFTDRSLGEITAWLWNFGDGTTSVLQNPIHTYTVPGVYTVALTVSGAAGNDTLTREELIRISQKFHLPLILRKFP